MDNTKLQGVSRPGFRTGIFLLLHDTPQHLRDEDQPQDEDGSQIWTFFAAIEPPRLGASSGYCRLRVLGCVQKLVNKSL
jgi:hypothetical protein